MKGQAINTKSYGFFQSNESFKDKKQLQNSGL